MNWRAVHVMIRLKLEKILEISQFRDSKQIVLWVSNPSKF